MKNKIINLEEIWLNSVTKFENVDGSTVWNIGEEAMLEFGKQLLELAAENATLLEEGRSIESSRYIVESGNYYSEIEIDINKQSILNTINQVVENEVVETKKQNIELTDEHMAYFSDDMYLPSQYNGMKVSQPYYSGDGNLSVHELQKLCNKYKEYVHQQQIIKQNLIKKLIQLKFGIEFPKNSII